MSRNAYIFLAAGGSFALLGGAFVFQILGFAPCAMCLWQRWPHAAAIVLGAVGFAVKGWVVPVLGALSAAATSVIGAYHFGVEQKWWEGPSSCTGGGLVADDSLLDFTQANVVMCDDIVWELFGLTMAGYNALFSAGLVVVWLLAARASVARSA